MDDYLGSVWQDLGGRIGGPLPLRLILQPLVATILAVRSGVRDARAGRMPYGWAVATEPGRRRELLGEGWRAVGKVFIVATIFDCVYQLIAFRWIYPVEALLVAFLLAWIPYLLVRGPAGRLTRWLSRA